MARKVSARVVLNRSKLTELGTALADGILEVGRTIIETANPPDSPLPPYPAGQGLPLQGGVVVYSPSGKLSSWHQRGVQIKKPRRVRIVPGAITGLVGFGFPGRFQEFGTVRHRAQPFFSPAVDEVEPHIAEIVRPFIRSVE